MSAGGLIHAPWTPEQVAGLNRWQQRGDVHPFTCGNEGCRDLLYATADGWRCQACEYGQEWAHAFMVLAAPDALQYDPDEVRFRPAPADAGGEDDNPFGPVDLTNETMDLIPSRPALTPPAGEVGVLGVEMDDEALDELLAHCEVRAERTMVLRSIQWQRRAAALQAVRALAAQAREAEGLRAEVEHWRGTVDPFIEWAQSPDVLDSGRWAGFSVFDGVRTELLEARARVAEMEGAAASDLGALELAWGIIANVSGGNWNRQGFDWHEAAARWRNDYMGRISERLAERARAAETGGADA